MPSSARRQKQGGNAILEFAIGWSVLWMLFAGVYQYGYSFYIYNRLLAAVGNAVQLGAKIDYDTCNSAAYTTTLQNMVLYADETAGTTPIVSGLTASQVNVSVTTSGSDNIPTDVTITIGSADTPYQIDGIFGKISLTGKPRATAKYYGRAYCSTS